MSTLINQKNEDLKSTCQIWGLRKEVARLIQKDNNQFTYDDMIRLEDATYTLDLLERYVHQDDTTS